MSAFDSVGKETVEAAGQVADREIPKVAAIVQGAEGTVKTAVADLLSNVANGVKQLLGVAYRLDGAKVTVQPAKLTIQSTITITLEPLEAQASFGDFKADA